MSHSSIKNTQGVRPKRSTHARTHSHTIRITHNRTARGCARSWRKGASLKALRKSPFAITKKSAKRTGAAAGKARKPKGKLICLGTSVVDRKEMKLVHCLRESVRLREEIHKNKEQAKRLEELIRAAKKAA